MRKIIWNLVVLALALAATIAVGWQLKLARKLKVNFYSKPPLVHLPPKIIPVLTLGHPEIYKDFIHIWALQVLPDSPDHRSAEEFMAFLRPILAHRPVMETLYMLSCFVVSSTYNKPEHCQEIIDIGLSIFPDSFRLPMAQGFIFAFKLDKPLQAAGYYFMASDKSIAPPYVKNIAIKLANREQVTDADLEVTLKTMLGHGKDTRFQEFLNEHAKKVLPRADDNEH